jgi:hypothetical protein
MGPQLISPLCDPRARFVRPIEPRRIHLTDHYLFRALAAGRDERLTRIVQNALTDDPFNARLSNYPLIQSAAALLSSDQLHFRRDFLKVPSLRLTSYLACAFKGACGNLIVDHA